MHDGGSVQSHCRHDHTGTRRVRLPCISTLRERRDMVFKTMSSRTILVATSDGERCGEAIAGKATKQQVSVGGSSHSPEAVGGARPPPRVRRSGGPPSATSLFVVQAALIASRDIVTASTTPRVRLMSQPSVA